MELEAVIARLQPIIDSTSLGIEWRKGQLLRMLHPGGPYQDHSVPSTNRSCRSGNMTWNIGSGGSGGAVAVDAVDPGIGPAVEAAIAISQATPGRHAAGIGRLLGRSTRRH